MESLPNLLKPEVSNPPSGLCETTGHNMALPTVSSLPPQTPEISPKESVAPSISTALNLQNLNRSGRPKGAKDKIERRQRKYMKVSYWFREIEKDWKSIEPAQRANLSSFFIKILLARMPKTPELQRDSLRNAQDVLQSLHELEQSVAQPTVISNDKDNLIKSTNT